MSKLREVTAPPAETTWAVPNIGLMLFHNAEHHPDTIALRPFEGGGLGSRTTVEMLDEVRAVAKGIVASGIEPGDRIAILARTRYEWTIFGWAVWLAGAVGVPIYETSSPEQIRWILSDSETKAILVETREHLATVESVREEGWALRNTWVIDDGAFEQLVVAGAEVSDEEILRRARVAEGTDVATIIYTSGTTGRPKGCEITHAGFIGVVASVGDMLVPRVIDPDKSTTLLFLPLAHVLARVVEIGCVFFRASITHEPDNTKLVEGFALVKPTFIVAVPRVLEKVYASALAKASAGGALRERIFKAAASVAVDYSMGMETGGPGIVTRLRHMLYSVLVYGKLHSALGGACANVVSGGSPLGTWLGHFFRGIGLELVEGYGMTESSGVITVNPPGATRIGTVGRLINGLSARIADDGELLVAGDTLFRAYHNNPAATAAEWDGRWFHTGDLGEFDEEGYLTITGRKKDIIVTAGGKNVAPAPIEDLIRSHPIVSQAMLVGDDRKYVAALITIDEGGFADWKRRMRREGEIADLVDDEALRAEVEAAIERGNKSVSKAESVRRFRIVARDWTLEDGELTPTLKLKRPVVAERFAADIEALYE